MRNETGNTGFARPARSVLGSLLLLALCHPGGLFAQGRTGWTANLGAGLNTPLGRTADFAHLTGTFTGGMGYQWNGVQALLVQYYATGLPFKSSLPGPLDSLKPESNLYSVTANYRRQFAGSDALHPYVIGGSGWYRRVTTITKSSVAGQVACSPWTGWLGYLCEGGFVPTEKLVAGSTLDALGFNIGAGIMGSIGGAARPHWFVEIRYHRASHAGIATQTLPITVGLTW